MTVKRFCGAVFAEVMRECRDSSGGFDGRFSDHTDHKIRA